MHCNDARNDAGLQCALTMPHNDACNDITDGRTDGLTENRGFRYSKILNGRNAHARAKRIFR